jgi:AhpD family alkylhydroperoxidase
MHVFLDHTADTAPEASRPALRATQGKFGFIPSAMARLAESPSVVAAFGRVMATWDSCSLNHLEREVVTLTVAHDSGCEVCMAIHSSILSRTVGDQPMLEALRAQTPISAPRLEALRLFTREVLDTKGSVSDAALHTFLSHGFSKQQALDVVLGVGLYTLSTYANRLTRATLDTPLAPFAWTPSGQRSPGGGSVKRASPDRM